MLFMMKNCFDGPIAENPPHTDENGSWERLYERIRVIALRRTAALMEEDAVDEAFDRGARALRTLMSAAEIARRMKNQDEKETDLHDGASKTPAYSDEDIRNIYRDITARVERIEREEEEKTADRLGDSAGDDCAGAGESKTKGVDEPCA
ncbi:MAG: hypothetical protein GXP06_15135 [Alphaproteobacteria bacterium]|nr:hypothetical protein [Alphaproteobacteria bacterium]